MTATVSKGKTISLEYTLKLDNSLIVETNVGEGPLTYTQVLIRSFMASKLR